MTHLRAALLLGVVTLVACAEPPSPPVAPSAVDGVSVFSNLTSEKTYVLLSASDALPDNLATAIAAAGGTLTSALNGAGIAIAVSANDNFAANAAKIPGIRDVGPDQTIAFTPPSPSNDVFEAPEANVEPQSHIGADETFAPISWAPGAISAPAAWHAGFRGAGARVAVIDGGIHSTHIDLRDRIEIATSRSFIPPFAFNEDVGTFWHGTHVAGILAATANTVGTVGIAPEATIIGVKVLHDGEGPFSAVLNGVFYAATPIAEGGAGADILNLSLGALVTKGKDNAHLLAAVTQVVNYARRRGALVVVAAGNNGVDLGHSANLVETPAQNGASIVVSATGPLGFAFGATNFDRPASYTNFGQKAITLAGPGGDFALPGTANCVLPVNNGGFVGAPCWAFDMIIAPCRGDATSISAYCFGAGTSMATPAVSGVAALIVGKYGRVGEAQLQHLLQQSAADLGKPGNDPVYGRGRVNALRAVQ